MKKSELKKQIEEVITETLSEVDIDKTSGAVVMKKTTPPSEIKKVTAQGIDVELKEVEDIDSKLQSLVLVDPAHLNLKNSGGGEFPDSYTLTPKGIAVLKDIFNGNINESEDEEFDTPEKEPSKAELKKIDKEFSSSKFAKKLSAEEKERLDKLEAGIKKKLANPTKDNIAIVKQLISRADVKKLFKDGGKDLKALVSDIIG